MSILRIPSDTAPFEPLTERETSVLGLMAEGLSDREIAERLVVAYTTVKWYNRQIFNKLGVDNRRAAIERARTLGLLGGDAPAPVPRQNLPVQLTPFIGREKELRELTRLLREPDVRLVTILAPGGMGKTRLAVAGAEALLMDFPNGVTFVPLAALSSPVGVIPFIAEQAGYQFQRDRRTPTQQLCDFLSNKTTLLVLDNFEHLLDGAPLITDLLQASTGLRVLVTSRERLNLHSETVYTLYGMDYPESQAEDVMAYSTARLFAQCARRARSNFEPESFLPDIARVCQLSLGMPLAIELAAAWAEVLTPAEIVDEISHSLDFLATEMRDVPERLRSVRAVFESTWRRLSDEEQSAFMKLSVFRGGCTRKAALAVAGVGLPTLTTLANKALLTWIPDDERYIVHELLRQYAAEQLEQAGLAAAVRDVHSAYYGAALAERENDLKGGRQLEAVHDIATDLENVKAGLQWAIDRRLYTLAGQYVNSLGLFYRIQSRFHEGEAFFSAVAGALANQPEARSTYGRALLWHGDNLSLLSHNEAAITVLHQALDIARELDDKFTMALCLQRLGSAAVHSSRYGADAESYCQQALALAHALGDKFIEAHTLHSLGFFHMLQRSDMTTYYHYTLEAYRLRRETGEVYGMASSLVNLSDYCQRMGQWEQAEHYTQEGYELARKLANLSMRVFHLRNRVAQLFYRGDLQAVETCIREGLGYAREIVERAHIQALLFQSALLCLARGQYVEARQLADDALAEALQILSGTSFQAHYPLIALGCALCGLGEYRADYLQKGLRWASEAPAANVATRYALTGIACVFAHDGQPERALELLSLVIHHRLSPTWWGEHEPLTLHLLDELRNMLPPDVYTEIWERGRGPDLEAVITELGET